MSNISTVVSGRMEEAYGQIVLPYLNDYMGKVFEEITKQYIEKYADLFYEIRKNKNQQFQEHILPSR